MIKLTLKLFICFLFIAVSLPAQQSAQAGPESLTRRLFLDLFQRLPTVEEYKTATELIQKGNYETLVNAMMKSEEYFMTLSSQMVKHYAPPKEDRVHNFLSYKRLEYHVKEKYVSKKTDFRKFLGDIMTARGIPASNPMVLMYSPKEDTPKMTARLSAQILGVPLKCAQCHDHKIHPDIVHDDFWSMAAFFKDLDIKLVSTAKEMSSFEKKFKAAAKGEKGYEFEKDEITSISKWMELEAKGESIYNNLTDEELLGQDIGHGLTQATFREKRLNRSETEALKAPQMYIGESKRSLANQKIDYELDGKKFTSRASHFKRRNNLTEKDRPRDILSDWMAWKEPLYISRATANWVTNWLVGRGWIMPAYDTYKVEGPNARRLDKLASTFMGSRFNIHALVKSVLMSDYYQMKNSLKNDEAAFAFFRQRRLRHLSGEQLVNSLNRAPKDIIEKADSAEKGMGKLYKIAVYKNNLVEKIFPVSLEDTEASYRGTLTQALKLSTDNMFLKYTKKLAEMSYTRFRDHGVELFLDDIFTKLYTRKPTKNEIAFFKAKIDFSKNFNDSGTFETVWTLINSPEMRLY